MREIVVIILSLTLALASLSPHPAVRGASSTWAVAGGATWYDWRPGEAAAGPLLRDMLGDWRGRLVRVSVKGKSVVVRLTDWCACGPRHGTPTLIDLDVRSFEALAPRSVGVLSVIVSPVDVPAPPETSTAP
jgi:hypothetical protein